MQARHVWLVVSAAFLMGCGSSPEEPVATAPAAAGEVDYLAGIATAAPPETPETLTEKRTRLELNLKLAQESADRGELDQAIQLLEDAVMLDPKHRTVLLLLTQYLHTRSLALVTEDPRRAFGLMRQSGGYMRMLRDAHHDFSAEERDLFASVLFDEACAHARANRQEDSSVSLLAAIDAGFDDLARLEMEGDFAEFRKVPKMAKMLSDAAAQVQSRTTQQARELLAASGTSEVELSRLGGQPPSIDFSASRGKVVVVVVGREQDERLDPAREQVARVQQRLASPDLKIKYLNLEGAVLTSLPGSPQPPAILFIDRAGKLRLVLTGSQRPAVLEAIARELISSPWPG